MKDYQAQLEKLRRDAADCGLIRDLATDKAKRELFDCLSSHLTVLEVWSPHIVFKDRDRRPSLG